MEISQADQECYQSLKVKLLEQLRQGKRFDKAGEKGLVGLLNQGATCYLNALLKILFNIQTFQNAILQNTSDSQVILALQKLIGLILLSKRNAVSTKELTTAFGWSNAEVFDQHDALELFSVLIDVIEKEYSEPDTFNKLFRGQQTDILKCPECTYTSALEGSFLDVALHIPQVGGREKAHLLEELFKLNTAEEQLGTENAWECSKCSKKVQALKSLNYKSLPPVLIVNLKRIGFDAATARRRKITDPVLFPLSVQSAELVKSTESDVDCKYLLTSILLHNGSASGGHYRAYVRDIESNNWFEHNDADVRKISDSEKENLFWYQGSNSPTSTAVSSPTEDGKARDGSSNNSIYEAAYVLVYQKEDMLRNNDVSKIPQQVLDYVQADNDELDQLQVAYGVYNRMTNLHVSCIGVDNETSNMVTIELPANMTLSEATAEVYSHVVAARVSSGMSTLPDVSLCRLRRYERSCHRLGETFGGRESETLGALGLGIDHIPSGLFVRVPEGCSVALEFRKQDETFSEFNGKEMQLRIIRWSLDSNGMLEEAESNISVIPGEDASSVGALRQVAVSSLNFGGDTSNILKRIILMKDSDRGPVLLDDDSKLLKKDYRIFSGAEVFVELLGAELTKSTDADEKIATPVYAALLNRKQMIQILYNVPVAAGTVPEYNLSVQISSACTLKEFKDRVIKSGNLGSVSEFHVRRNATGAQIKSEQKSLDELGITNQSIIHLQIGVGCAPGEHLLRFEVEVDSSIASDGESQDSSLVNILLGELPIKERSSVLQVKERIIAAWNEMQTGKVKVPLPPSAHHLRLRDGKVGSQSGPLRDERAIGKCLLGMADGRKVIVQILPNAETIAADDLLLFVRLASYEKKVLSKPYDFFIPKKITVQQLCDKILLQHPEAADTSVGSSLIGVAKAFSTGPPLTLKSALKLKWTDDTDSKPVDVATVTIDQPPLSIRDGATLVVRDTASFQRAREAAKLKKEAEGSESGGLDATESPMRGTLRPGTRGSRLRPSTNSRKTREKGVSIMSNSSSQSMLPPSSGGLNYDAPTLPPASPGKGDTAEPLVDLPNAPVRIVKALRGDSVDEK